MNHSIDLHVHLRGTLEPILAQRLAAKNHIVLPKHLIGDDGQYKWSDFRDFLEVYDRAGKTITESQDLWLLTDSFLSRSASEGAIYVEFMHSPNHSADNGIPFEEQLTAITSAMHNARSAYGIEARLILTCVRHRGPEEALALAEWIAANPEPLVVGFGMAGNEMLFDPAEFSGAFLVAKNAGLGLTAHAGEWNDARSVLRSVETLGLTRIGHGIRATDDDGVLSKLRDLGIGFEICLSSNVAMGVLKPGLDPALAKLAKFGCRLSFASDDPAYFKTSTNQEWRLAHAIGLTSGNAQHKRLIDSAEMAFCDQVKKDTLIAKITDGP